MREIKFRGKDLLGKWRYGDFIQEKWKSILNTNEKAYMIKKDKRAWTVDKETLGQYTGLKDKNGVEIYEGDIVKINNDYEKYGINAGEIYQVYFKSGGYRLLPKYCKEALGYWLENGEDFVVIGNIYDNPELLKESD